MKSEAWIGLCTFCICFVIGLPCWLVGCNPDLPNGCLTRALVNMSYVGKTLESGVCCSWCYYDTCTTDSKGRQSCTTHSSCCGGYFCYSCAYKFDLLVATSSDPQKTCTQECGGVYYNPSTALDNKTSAYTLGGRYVFAYDDRTHLCQSPYKSRATWIAGVFFLCLAALHLAVPLLWWITVGTMTCLLFIRDQFDKVSEDWCTSSCVFPTSLKTDQKTLAPPPFPLSVAPSAPLASSALPEGLCLICISAKANLLLRPCNHECFCEDCFKTWSETLKNEKKCCPICREHVSDSIKVFLT